MSVGQASVTRARALNALRIGLLVVIVAACVIALWANWQEVSGQLRKLSVPVVRRGLRAGRRSRRSSP